MWSAISTRTEVKQQYLGWYKHGTINDRTLVENNNNTNSNNNNHIDNQVNASENNYCIVQLISTINKF